MGNHFDACVPAVPPQAFRLEIGAGRVTRVAEQNTHEEWVYFLNSVRLVLREGRPSPYTEVTTPGGTVLSPHTVGSYWMLPSNQRECLLGWYDQSPREQRSHSLQTDLRKAAALTEPIGCWHLLVTLRESTGDLGTR